MEENLTETSKRMENRAKQLYPWADLSSMAGIASDPNVSPYATLTGRGSEYGRPKIQDRPFIKRRVESRDGTLKYDPTLNAYESPASEPTAQTTYPQRQAPRPLQQRPQSAEELLAMGKP